MRSVDGSGIQREVSATRQTGQQARVGIHRAPRVDHEWNRWLKEPRNEAAAAAVRLQNPLSVTQLSVRAHHMCRRRISPAATGVAAEFAPHPIGRSRTSVASSAHCIRHERGQRENRAIASRAQRVNERRRRSGEHGEVVRRARHELCDLCDVTPRFLHPDDVRMRGQSLDSVGQQVDSREHRHVVEQHRERATRRRHRCSGEQTRPWSSAT